MPRPSRAPIFMTVYPSHSGAVTWGSAAAVSVSDCEQLRKSKRAGNGPCSCED